MAETLSPRFGLQRWSQGTDTPSRVEFDTAHANIDLLGAIDRQDTLVNRPASSIRGTYFWDTTNSLLWRDSGSSWSVVGSRVRDALSNASTAGSVPFTARGAASQTANLFEAQASDTSVLASISAAGALTLASTAAAKSINLTNDTIGTHVAFVQGANGQTGDMIRVRTNGGTNVFRVLPAGGIESAYLRAAANQGVIGAGTASNVANMTAWSGAPLLEVVGTAQTGAYSEFMMVKHASYDSNSATRRLGILLKMGGETLGDAAKSAAFYIQSTDANAASPVLKIARGETVVMEFAENTATQLFTGLVTSGGITANSLVSVLRTAGTDAAFSVSASGDSFRRFNLRADGRMTWGPATTDTDVTLARSATSELTVTGNLKVTGNLDFGGDFTPNNRDANTYNPVWTTDGTAPSLGNGSITGTYFELGPYVFFTVKFNFGSTTSFGTGRWSVNLPFQAAAGKDSSVSIIANDNSTATRYSGASLILGGSDSVFRLTLGSTIITNTAPFTWAVSDTLVLSGFYERA